MMGEPVTTRDGWYCLHDFRTINWTSWKQLSSDEQEAAMNEFLAFIDKWQQVEDDKNGSHALYTITGHKADFVMMLLRPTMEELNDIENAFNKTTFAEHTTRAHSYVSVVELSNYMPPKEMTPEMEKMEKERLYPILPKWEHFCFYPMDKRRQGNDNWYSLPFKDRAELMYSHGMIGRKYAGRIKQIILGSVGFDAWEWGVTLFAHDVLDFKKIVYEMRFDEVSARYGEFGDFYVGHLLTKERIPQFLSV